MSVSFRPSREVGVTSRPASGGFDRRARALRDGARGGAGLGPSAYGVFRPRRFESGAWT